MAEKSRTILIFGGVHDDGSPDCAIPPHFGRDAYEHYQLTVYMRELLNVRNDPNYVCWSPSFELLFQKAKALGRVQFEELGSTLFSTIDKFDKLAAAEPLPWNRPRISYTGIEISKLFIDVATIVHPRKRLRHFARWQDIPPSTLPILSRSFQSTSYAFQSTEDLYAWVSRSVFGIHGIRFYLDGGDTERAIAGNRHTFFDPERFADLAKNQGDCYVIKAGKQTIGDVSFALTWVVFDRFDKRQNMKSSPGPKPICDLSRKDLSSLPNAPGGSKWLHYKPGRKPFDFSNDQWLGPS